MPGQPAPAQRRRYRRQRIEAITACLLIVGVYFLVPVEPGLTGTRMLLRGVATLLGVLIIGWLVWGQVRRRLGGDTSETSLIRLAMALVAGLMSFALADYVIAVSRPGQFVGLQTKIDACYFALATLTTIGYGDVHAAGQVARVAVCLQMGFSIGVLATGASVLFKGLSSHLPGQS